MRHTQMKPWTRRYISILVAICTLLMCAPIALAAEGDTGTDGDYTWKELSDGTVAVTGYDGMGINITVPSTLDGKTVTAIGERAFIDCRSLVNVTIQSNVTTIGQSAFERCSSLTSITLPDGLTTIDTYAFYDCTSLTSITLPDGLTTIGNSVFEECRLLTDVTIPSSVTSIGRSVFIGTAITEVTIPYGVTTLNYGVFGDCSSLTDVTIPSSVTTIDGIAFAGCTSLTSMTLPSSVTSIGERAFIWCTALDNVTILSRVATFDGDVFSDTPLSGGIYGVDGSTAQAFAASNGYTFHKLQTPVSISARSASYNSVRVSWDAVTGADGYSIYRATKSSGPYKYLRLTSGTSFVDSGLTTGQRYYYRVRSYTISGGKRVYDIFAPAVAARPIPAAPSNVRTTDKTDTTMSLAWNAVSGASGYRVYRKDSGSNQFVLIANTTATSYKNTGLRPGTAYTYKVVAYRTMGSGKIGGYQSNTAWNETNETPGVPTSIHASSTSYNSVQVSWDAVTGADGYSIYRATKSSGPYTYLRLVSGTNFVDSALTAGQHYYYRVRSYTVVGGKRVYNTFAPAVAARPIPAISANFSITDKTYTTMSLSWDAVSGATGYRVYRRFSSAFVQIADITDTSYTDTGLRPGECYTHKIVAYCTVGGKEIGGYACYSSLNMTTVGSGIPESIQAHSESYDSIQVSWDEISAADGYSIYRATKSTGPYKYLRLVSGTSFVDSGLTAGQHYYYRVRSYVMDGSIRAYGTFAPAVAARTIPTAPTNFSMTEKTDTMSLSWDAVSGATGYRVYRKDSDSGTYTQIADVTAPSYEDIGLTADMEYNYEVAAYCTVDNKKISGCSSKPSTYHTTKDSGIPASIQVRSQSYDSIQLSWDAVAGANGYSIYRAEESSGPYTYLCLELDTSFVDSKLTKGHNYYYRVRSYTVVDGNRVYNTFSPELSARAIPAAPNNFRITNITDTTMLLSWSRVSEVGYRVYRKDADSGTFTQIADVTAGSYTDIRLTPGTEYSYKVVSYCKLGNRKIGGDSSDPISAQTTES